MKLLKRNLLFKYLYLSILVAVFATACSSDDSEPDIDEDSTVEIPECNRSAGEKLNITGHFTIDATGNIWFTRDNKFYTLSPEGMETEIGGSGEAKLEDGSFRSAQHLVWHPDGYVVFIDASGTTDSWVRKITSEGNITTLVQIEAVGHASISNENTILFCYGSGSNSRTIFELAENNTLNPLFVAPQNDPQREDRDYVLSAAFDDEGNLFYTTSSALYKVESSNTPVLVAGDPISTGDVQGSPSEARFSGLKSLAMTTDGAMYAIDPFAQKLLQITDTEVSVFASQETDGIELPFELRLSANGEKIYVLLQNGDIYSYECN